MNKETILIQAGFKKEDNRALINNEKDRIISIELLDSLSLEVIEQWIASDFEKPAHRLINQ